MWKNLPICIKKRVGQASGYGFSSSKKSDHGFDLRGTREFQVGDSPRLVSRSHLAKFDETIVLEKFPDRSAIILLLVDASASELLGSTRTKFAAYHQIVRGFVSACLSKNIAVILAAFTTTIEYESGIIRGASALEGVMDDLATLHVRHKATDPEEVLGRAWDIANQSQQRADMVCIMSDFLFTEPCTNELESLTDATDVIAVVMRDKIEYEIPPIAGGFHMRDAETGHMFWVSGLSEHDPLAYLGNIGIDICILDTKDPEEDQYQALHDFFKERGDAP